MTAVTDSSESEEEDLSRFREAVDFSFTSILGGQSLEKNAVVENHTISERNLDIASHYSDVKVPAQLQHQIGTKVSSVISRNIEFVDVTSKKHKTMKVKGGVKLFKDSPNYLCCDDTEDMYTKLHNQHSKKIIKYLGQKHDHDTTLSESDKLTAATVDGSFILSAVETKLWKSRRKPKIFKYKSLDNSSNTYYIVDND